MGDSDGATGAPAAGRRGIAPQDILGGLAIATLGLFALWLTSDLAVGRAMRMGPGYLPRLLGWGVTIGGLLVALGGALGAGPRLEGYQLRGPLLVLGAIVLFGLCVRGFTLFGLVVPPLGIALSAFLAVFTCSFATREARPLEALIYAVVLAAFCSVLFRIGLGLPLEIWPRALLY